MQFPSISYRLAQEIGEKTGQEIRVTVPGHFQRGGSPCPYDRILATRFGTAAARLIQEKNYGNMVALQSNKIVPIPLNEVAGKLKGVPADCDIVQTARDIGIHFGD
jgi:6-phosphofructokinase